jgi:hypothetical protein
VFLSLKMIAMRTHLLAFYYINIYIHILKNIRFYLVNICNNTILPVNLINKVKNF